MNDISVPIVAFIFVCIIFPKIVKNKAQFYMAFAVLLLILALDIVAVVTAGSVGFVRFLLVLRGVLYIGDFVLLVLATGGLSLHELGGELKGAYEVMRRGETEKTVVIPKSQVEAERAAAAKAAQAQAQPAPPAAPPAKPPEGDRTIPLG